MSTEDESDDISVLRGILHGLAAESATITYGELAAILGISMASRGGRSKLFRLLNATCSGEHAQGRPMLGALVVRSDTGTPGEGFYKVAMELGLYEPGDDKPGFHAAEVKKVWGTRYDYL